MKRELKELENMKIAFLGLGVENQALIDFLLKKKIKCDITICDFRNKVELGDRFKKYEKLVGWRLGKSFNINLGQFDIFFRSPGWPIDCPSVNKALKEGSVLTSPMNLFFDLVPTKNIIGVTGTKGKGTTASLIYHILKTAKKKVFLGGNIGVAPFSFLNKIKKNDYIVLELSSFQLEDLKFSPRIAVLTNLFKEHLKSSDPVNPNYHKSLSSYLKAKLNIVKYQQKGDFFVLNPNLKKTVGKTKAAKIYFKSSDLTSKLNGEYNKENIGAALEVANILKIKKTDIVKAVKTFKGLPHRLEFVKKIKGVEYYDNSFSTTPESTIADIHSFNNPLIMLIGGADKGASFRDLASLLKRRVRFIILLKGTGTVRIKKELERISYPKKHMKLVNSMKEAVKVAKKNGESGDLVILSTACASFGMFKNYKERGDLFKKFVLGKNSLNIWRI